MLIDCTKLGGSVCLIAGTGHGESKIEAAGWNKLLTAFGLYLEPSYNDTTGVLPVTSPAHPLFAGVKALYQYWGQTIHLLPDSKASIIMSCDSKGLIGLAKVPVPAQPAQARPAILSDGAVIKLQSSMGDFIHCGMSSEVVMYPSKSIGRDYTGNQWKVEVNTGNKIRLRSQAGDYLHRPDNREVIITRGSGDDNKIRLRSWKVDYLYRPSPNPAPPIHIPIMARVTKLNTDFGTDGLVKVVPPAPTAAW